MRDFATFLHLFSSVVDLQSHMRKKSIMRRLIHSRAIDFTLMLTTSIAANSAIQCQCTNKRSILFISHIKMIISQQGALYLGIGDLRCGRTNLFPITVRRNSSVYVVDGRT